MPLKNSQEANYTRSLIEASLDPLVTISLEGKITDVNEASINVTSVERLNLIGTDFCNYFTEPEKARDLYLKAFEEGSVSDYPLTIRHKTGNLTDVLYNASVYKDENGNVLGVFAAARDVTDQIWAKDLRVANKELLFQNNEKEKRAAELIVANKELAFQNNEKEKRAAELVVANSELAYQNQVKEKRAAELIVANEELAFQNNEKEKRALELAVANKELAFQNDEKEKRAAELIVANKELAFQNNEKEKRAAELIIANKELLFQSLEKEKRAAELIIANKELLFQNDEKEKRAAELIVANKELLFQSVEKEKRAAELIIANKELDFQNEEKEKRAAELIIANYARGLIEASRDPLFTISPSGKITDMNHATIRVTGKSREELIGSDFFNYFTEPDKAREGYQEVFAKGFVTDYPLTIKDNVLTDVLFNGSIYKDDKGNVIGAVVVARDITEQKRVGKELIESKIFAELATEIAEEAKIKAENAAEIANDAVKSKQQFLSNMSHEIRTPLNAIIGFTKVVLKTELTGKQKEYLNAIKVSGDALIVLINDILDLAKVDAGKMTFEKAPFKMESSMLSMLHLFEPKIQEKNLKLIRIYDEKIPEVLLGDSVRLHQIIINLISNAVKFTNKGSITVNVELLEQSEEYAVIQFSISDTGIGIPANRLDKIFENFEQASSNTSRIFGGTGLGLAIVKQLVESQGGTISVKSEILEGSKFSFVLKFMRSNAKLEIEPICIELDDEIKNIKVLVVEDIALNQLLMKTLLDDFGFERDIAANGKIAIDKLKEKSYDIILMDLQMPEMNGFEATEYIRKTMNSKIPIIALTADVTTVDLEKCKEVGMDDYMAKPVDEKVLYNKIIGLVKKTITNKPSEVNIQINEVQIRHTSLVYLKERTKSNPLLMVEMISLYLEQTPPLILSMKQSFEEKDWHTLHAAIHKMIPSFSIVGINKDFEEMAKKIMLFATTQEETEGVQELVMKVEEVCINACKELKEELNRIKSTTNEK